jgi:malate/lactate dehydrogenase
MTRDDLFNINAGIVKNLVGAAAKYCPEVGAFYYCGPRSKK